ncbi:MAG: aldo/keto reductase [Spirochaetaceae bacterium]|jgi:predicted aldo/keto reductase-like oxidoreductase|nr:aldo/keto reductase [Spirochaetaceae bacterium]
MRYRPFGKTGKMLSALGVGTMRFNLEEADGFENAVKLTLEAVKRGVNYIDTSFGYLGGQAEKIAGEAVRRSGKEVYVTVKSNGLTDISADACYDRIRASLKSMGLPKAQFFILWTVLSYDDFVKMTLPGAAYEGALRAKEEGLIEHICMSAHASPENIIKIMRTGKIEGVTISYSVLTPHIFEPVLRTAAELGIGVVTMNSLGGGLIPQNPDVFSFVKQDGDESVAAAALSWSYAHSQITTVLSGMTTLDELNENIRAFDKDENPAADEKRVNAVNSSFSGVTGFCTGCGYCVGCPAGIDIAVLMQAFNAIKFTSGISDYRRKDPRLLENIRICYRLNMISNFMPPDTENPCLKCGECENKCTQRLPIIKRLDEIYRRFDESGYSEKHIADRLKSIFAVAYKKVAFWSASLYTKKVFSYFQRLFPSLEPELFIFDKNEKLWGSVYDGIRVESPDKLLEIKPDIVVISNYVYSEEIYEDIKRYEDDGIRIVKIHAPQDVPWLF